MHLEKKQQLSQKRRWRIRKKVIGTAERPRLTACFTNNHIHVQCIDDISGTTKVAISSVSKIAKKKSIRPNVAGAEQMGELIAELATAAKIKEVVFDRAGRRYHGRVKALADAARQGGLIF